MIRIALRSHRWSTLGVALIGFVATYAQGAAFKAAAGTTLAEREAFARQVAALGPQLAYLIPLPVHPEKMAGYLMWRGYGFLPVIFGFWAFMAATGAIRGDEDGGRMETWLASSVGRVRLVGARLAAFTIAAVLAVGVTAVGGFAAMRAGGDTIGPAPLVEQSVALLGLVLVCFTVGLAVAQLMSSRRAAAAVAGVVLLALFMIDSLSRVRTGLGGWVSVSPFHLYNETRAIAPGGDFDGGATIALYAIAVVLAALAAAAFVRRDLLASLFGGPRRVEPPVHVASRNPLLRAPVLSALYEQRLGLVAWILGTALVAAFMVSLTKTTSDLFESTPGLHAYLQATGAGDARLLVLGQLWFGLGGLLIAAYTITQVARWASEDGEGRLEMTIAQPVRRGRVVLERCATLAVGVAAMAGAGTLVVVALAPGQGVELDGGRTLLATALLVLLGLTFGGLGALVISRLPRVPVPLLGMLALGGYFMLSLGPLFKWPEWVLDLSLFRLYGTPLTSGVYWTGLWSMLAVTVVGFGVGLVAMRFREVGR